MRGSGINGRNGNTRLTMGFSTLFGIILINVARFAWYVGRYGRILSVCNGEGRDLRSSYVLLCIGLRVEDDVVSKSELAERGRVLNLVDGTP